MIDLFTVLIAEKEHIDAIQQENKLFFEPFLENKELAFCEWNPEGQSLQDSVPGLQDAVGRRKIWRAVVINTNKVGSVKDRNPFDVVGSDVLADLIAPETNPKQDAFEEWETAWEEYFRALAERKEKIYRQALENPLTRLATRLCFRPEDYILNDVQEKRDVRDWAMAELGRDTDKPSVRLELMEKEQYKRELRLKENIRREFMADRYLNIAYPTEMHCISIRTAENGFFDPDNYWNVRRDSDYSSFADRNMYFDKMRFMVFDLLAQTHRNFRTDYIRFLASVLTFVSNPVPASAMQARKLYQLEVETDDTPLCTMVTSYDKKLAATWDVIENEMEKIRSEIPGELTDKAAEAMFCTPTDVEVVLDESCNPEKMIAEKDYGLFFDRPENEFNKWTASFDTAEKTLTYIAKQRLRSVRKSTVQMHLSSEVSHVNVSRLTPLQIDDVREYTDAAENEMVASTPPGLTEMSVYKKRMEREDENVKKVISRRMTKKTTIWLMVICLGLFLLCFLPCLLSNQGNANTVMTAVGLGGGMLLALGLVLFIALFVLRLSVLSAVKAYNNTASGILAEIEASLGRFSKYLSAACNVRRGHAVQNFAKKNLDEYTKSLRIRKKHQEDIRKKRACLLESYRDYFADRSYCDETMSRPFEYDFEQAVEYEYPAPFMAGDCRQIEFISSGNYITVPSSYITSILVRMEGIYEK